MSVKVYSKALIRIPLQITNAVAPVPPLRLSSYRVQLVALFQGVVRRNVRLRENFYMGSTEGL
jgi:hypothetical protein